QKNVREVTDAAGRRVAADEIRALLSTYARALQTGDGALLRRVQPGLSEADVRKNLDAFDRVTSVKAVDESIEISGRVALVRGRLDVVADKQNRPSQTQSRFSFVLVRTTAGWHIERATK